MDNSEFNLGKLLEVFESIEKDRLEQERIDKVSPNDITRNMSWKEFIHFLTNSEFKIAYKEEFTYEEKSEEAVALYHDDGLIIWTTSWGNSSFINECNLYGEIESLKTRKVPIECSWYPFGNGKYAFKFGGRDHILYNINKLKQSGQLIQQWEQEDKFLWFLNYSETKVDSYDYKEISRNKMMMFCDEAKKIISKYI